ncbi:uncharacterized protein LOC119484743 isoform X2 [Sebastes umbrosus]|uniref:uncharacterized protein LOC119484743 isoform X2 n=1 Tax=Sebastes umbrosus TaxID=72105 RepID=UPI00189D3D17|nr:uncharacterized protein LOC119484743 isoform X2 [Sebastes umbrosus]
MSDPKLQSFRSFLTERFTSVAMEIFEELESIVGTYYEENKRLRSVLHTVLNPELKLTKIDVHPYTGATTDVKELITMVEISEPVSKKLKEEQIEYDISLDSEQQQQGLGEADNFITPDCVKNDPKEEDVSWDSEQQQQGLGAANNFITQDCVKNDPEEDDVKMPCITNSFHIKMAEFNPNSSGTLTADEDDDRLESDSDADSRQLSRSEESSSESQDPQKHDTKSKKSLTKPKWSLQKTMLELPRMKPHQSYIPDPAECQSFLAKLTEAFKDFPDDQKPLITKMGLTEKVELVDCAFGKVPKGCPLSYQCPVPSDRDYKIHDDAPFRPLLPLAHHRLKPMLAFPTLSAKEQEHVNIMQINWEAARSLEHSTRGRKDAIEELRNLRLTNRFREICKLKPGRSNAEHLIFKIQRGLPSSKTAQMEEEMKTEALREYCKHLSVNWSPCGLVVHPNAPWLGALPDGLVYDPKETPNFGLVHVKCIGFQSFIECKFLFCRDGVLQLKRTHKHYWHIQGEMMVTGTEWCDLLVFSREDILVQRIYRDTAIIKVMKKKLDDFFFYYYLPCLF